MNTREFEVGERPRLEIGLISGRVDVETGPAGRLTVQVDAPGGVVVQRTGDIIVIGRGDQAPPLGKVRCWARVPEGTVLDFHSASASLWAGGRLGAVRARTASGSISLEKVESAVVKTASGSVQVEVAAGDVDVSTASGSVRLGEVSGAVRVTTMSGNVRVEVAARARCRTVSGEIRLDRCTGPEVDLKTVSGNLVVGVPTGTRVDADLVSQSGRIELPSGGPTRPPEREMRVRVRTVSGDLRIERLG